MKKLLFALVMLIYCGLLHGFDDINNDFQIWLYAETKKKINSCLDIKLSASERREKNATRPYYEYGQIELQWKPNACWIIGPIYRQAYARRVNSEGKTWWKPDAVPIFNITRVWSGKKIKLADRSWFQYSSISRKWTYRNRIELSYPSKYTPFIYNEFFWERFNRFSQNRFQVGFQTPSCGMFKLVLAYMLRSKESGDSWINQHVLAMTLNVQF